jgi:hypothetical protein
MALCRYLQTGAGPEIAAKLRIEERKLEAGGRN